MQCYKHPKIATELSCGRCERPICTNCGIPGPAGIRCRECASLRSSVLYRISPQQLILGTVAALAVGVIGGYALFLVSFFVFFLGPAYGALVAEVVSRASGRKQGPILTGIAIGGIVIGAIIGLVAEILPEIQLVAQKTGHSMSAGEVLMLLGATLPADIWPLIGTGLAIAACYARMR